MKILTALLGLLLISTGLPVHAADPDDVAPGASRTPPALRIAIDPRTGLITAAPPASAAPRPAVSSVPLAGVRLQSGATRVDLKGRYQMAVVAHRDAEGVITTTCEPASALPGKQNRAAAGQGEVPREK
ncbi:MAG TPA: hypothetical protein VF425_04495 [Thermoanaerobaculia bacterium]